jgi:type IV pilus assembly protein PilM
MKRRTNSPQRWLGLDMGQQSIKVVEMERTAAGLRLVKHLVQELPPAPPGGSIDLSGWLQTILKEFESRTVHVALSGPDVVMRRVQIPPMPSAEVPEAVRWHVKDQVPFAIQDAAVAWQLLGEVWEKDVKKQDLLVAVAPQQRVRELVTLVEHAGGRVAHVLPSQWAMWQSVSTLSPDTQSGALAMVDVGTACTHIAIVQDGAVCIVRDLAMGVTSVTQALVGAVTVQEQQIDITAAKATTLARQYGILTEEATGTTDEGIPLFHIASLMRPVLEGLLMEISRSLEYYRAHIDQGGVARILLCGGGANLKGLQSFLADGLSVTTEVFNALVRVPERMQSCSAEQMADEGPRLSVAIGTVCTSIDHFDLMQMSRSSVGGLPLSPRQLRRAGIGIGGALLLSLVGLWIYSGVLGGQVRDAQAAWAQVEPMHMQYTETVAAQEAAEATTIRLALLLEQRPVWDGVLKELGVLVPASMILDTYAVQARTTGETTSHHFTLAGRMRAGGSTAGGVSQLVQALERSIFFRDVTLESSEVRTGDAHDTVFEIEGRLE